jgi:hypothetical protein
MNLHRGLIGNGIGLSTAMGESNRKDSVYVQSSSKRSVPSSALELGSPIKSSSSTAAFMFTSMPRSISHRAIGSGRVLSRSTAVKGR